MAKVVSKVAFQNEIENLSYTHWNELITEEKSFDIHLDTYRGFSN